MDESRKQAASSAMHELTICLSLPPPILNRTPFLSMGKSQLLYFIQPTAYVANTYRHLQ